MRKYRKVKINNNKLEAFYLEASLKGLDYSDEVLMDSWLHSLHPNHTVHTETLHYNKKKDCMFYIISK